jgi:phosphatidylserine/phosphatidylglycerophosphate/cardiolipin synthase-like enzyme
LVFGCILATDAFAAVKFKRFPHCGEGLVTVKTCECHAINSRIWHFCHAGEYCRRIDGKLVTDERPNALICPPSFLVRALSHADPAITVHYAPAENLEHIDVALIDSARREIDFAAYVLTDWLVMQALTRAAERSIKVRIYLDGTQFAEREPTKVFEELVQWGRNPRQA